MADPKSEDLVRAVSALLPVTSQLVQMAQASGGSDDDKHNAVAAATEAAYKALQAIVPELRIVPWDLIAPVIVPVETGLIVLIVRFFKNLGHALFAKKTATVDPAAPV